MPKSARACKRCISRKRRCGHELPTCTGCQKVGEECEYPPPRMKRGPVTGLVRAAESRAQECENALYWIMSLEGVEDLIRARQREMRTTTIPTSPSAKLKRTKTAQWWQDHRVDSIEGILNVREDFDSIEGTGGEEPDEEEEDQEVGEGSVPPLLAEQQPEVPFNPQHHIHPQIDLPQQQDSSSGVAASALLGLTTPFEHPLSRSPLPSISNLLHNQGHNSFLPAMNLDPDLTSDMQNQSYSETQNQNQNQNQNYHNQIQRPWMGTISQPFSPQTLAMSGMISGLRGGDGQQQHQVVVQPKVATAVKANIFW